MTPAVKILPVSAGTPAKVTADRVERFLVTLRAAGYGCAIFARDFQPGKFVITLDAAHGYTVSWIKLGGLREVCA